jgi:hypothetical protein
MAMTTRAASDSALKNTNEDRMTLNPADDPSVLLRQWRYLSPRPRASAGTCANLGRCGKRGAACHKKSHDAVRDSRRRWWPVLLTDRRGKQPSAGHERDLPNKADALKQNAAGAPIYDYTPLGGKEVGHGQGKRQTATSSPEARAAGKSSGSATAGQARPRSRSKRPLTEAARLSGTPKVASFGSRTMGS